MCHDTTFPTQGIMPITTPTDNVIITAQKMIAALKQPAHILEHNISKNQMTALDTISKIFSNATLLTSKALPSATENTAPKLQPVMTQPVNQTTAIPHNNPHQIPFQEDEISQPRPATHRYQTRARNGSHIINNIIKTAEIVVYHLPYKYL